MEENRFFKLVWRLNSLVIMAAGALAIVVLSYLVYYFAKELTERRTVWDIVNITPDQRDNEAWQLGKPRNIWSTPYVMVSLYSDQDIALARSSKSSRSTRNILFINGQSNEKRWLLPTNEYLIVQNNLLSQNSHGDKERLVRAILYSIVKKDTNRDNRLTSNDRLVVALSLPSGEGYKEIFHDIDVLVGYEFLDDDSLLLVYQKREVGYSAKVTLDDFSIANDSEILIIENRP